MGRAMIMGRKTFESLPGVLPGRRHIVLTADRTWQAPGAEPAHDPSGALALAGDDAAIIGGGAVFALFEPIADRLELTTVWRDYAGDTFYMIDQADGWTETAREDHLAEGDRPAFSFHTLVRPSVAIAGPL